VGGEFSRYSINNHWLFPDFEKMFYGNALLPLAYTETFRYTRCPLYEQIICVGVGPAGLAHWGSTLTGVGRHQITLDDRDGRGLSRQTQFCHAGVF
jgi:hypothetical protein